MGKRVTFIAFAAVAVLALVFTLNRPASGSGQAGRYAYQVGKPGVGQQALPITLPSTDGSTFDLAAYRGQTVLLFFQEGIGCEPCWDQIRDIEAKPGEFQALGIDRMVSITGDPLDALKREVASERIRMPLLSDANLAVSKTYQTNLYGMMGTAKDGHSFILVDKNGTIIWRADYGGPPNYPMYIPIGDLTADIRAGLAGGAR